MDTALIVVICLMIAFCFAVIVLSDTVEHRYHQLHPPDDEEDEDEQR